MAAEKFNALKGFSVGIPAIDVIDSNGNIVTNVVVPSGNVTANKVYANHYYYANGTPFSSDPAGTNTEVQFNNNGVLGASANFTFNTTTQTVSVSNFSASGNLVNLGNVDNLQIDGGLNGYVLQTDGAGNLSWTAQTGNGGGGNGVPGGSNTQIQFNDSGSFAGSPYMTFNKSDNKVNFAGEVTANVFTMGSGSFEFRTSEICIANTTSTSNIELCQTPVEDLAALDYVIIATDEFSGKRQYLNINAVYYNTDVVYNETSALYIGGLVTDYDLTYVPGDVFLPARIVLWVTPATTNQITYKIMVQRYRD